MGFSRQEYWSVLPCSPPGDLPNSGVEPTSLALAGRLFLPLAPPGKPEKDIGVKKLRHTFCLTRDHKLMEVIHELISDPHHVYEFPGRVLNFH